MRRILLQIEIADTPSLETFFLVKAVFMARLAGLAVFLVGHALALNYENEVTRWHQVHEALKLDAPGEKLALTAMEGSPGGNLTAECEKCNTAVHLPASFCGNLGVRRRMLLL